MQYDDGNFEAVLLRIYEQAVQCSMQERRMVRVLLLNCFDRSCKMVQLPLCSPGGDTAGIDKRALDIVLRVPTARHSYRQDVATKTCPLDSNYTFAAWGSADLPHLPGLNYVLEIANQDMAGGCLIGIGVLSSMR